jgi:CubicO group peptidase (beta-lactamase class C family)
MRYRSAMAPKTDEESLEERISRFAHPALAATIAGVATAGLLISAYAVSWLGWLAWLAFAPFLVATRPGKRLLAYLSTALYVISYLLFTLRVSDLSRYKASQIVIPIAVALIVLIAEGQLLGKRLGRRGWLLPPLLWAGLTAAAGSAFPAMTDQVTTLLTIIPVSQPIFRLVAGTWASYALFFLVLVTNCGLAEAIVRLPARKGLALSGLSLALAAAIGLAGSPVADLPFSTPEAQGMDSGALLKMGAAIPKDLPQIRNVVVVRHGSIVFERYYRATTPYSFNEICSDTKSITGALVGIALKQGYLKNADQKIMDFFPDYASPSLDPQTADIRIRHLVTMTSGFDWDDTLMEARVTRSSDWVKATLATRLSDKPGNQFNYNTPAVNILSAIVNRAAHTSRSQFADRELFGPLGIYRRIWYADPQGNNYGGAYLLLRARDMAKFGQLYLDGGAWKGGAIIAPEWVEDSTKAHSAGGSPHGEKYGQLFWVTSAQSHSAFFAGGYGGQFIYVVPDLDLVVAITSTTDMHRESGRSIVPLYIIPAISK